MVAQPARISGCHGDAIVRRFSRPKSSREEGPTRRGGREIKYQVQRCGPAAAGGDAERGCWTADSAPAAVAAGTAPAADPKCPVFRRVLSRLRPGNLGPGPAFRL